MKQKKNAPYDAEPLLRATAEKLFEVLRSLELHGDGEHDSTVTNLARISSSVAAIHAELRQNEKAVRREVSQIQIETLVEHLKTLPIAQREAIARELTGADAEESLL